MRKSHRLFFASVPNAVVKNEILTVQQHLKGAGRAVRPDQFHVTLAFLGNQPAGGIPQLCEIAAGLRFETCELVLDRVNRFRRSSVLWLGAASIPAVLEEFRQTLIDQLDSAGYTFDRKPWKFHVTLYRRLRKPPDTIGPVAVNWQLNGFDLMDSVSIQSGVKYCSLGHWKGQSAVMRD
jgi:2'-5' RNA ligase